MNGFTAEIVYNKETLRALEDAVYDSFGVTGRIIKAAIALAMLIGGAYLNNFGGVILMVLGAIVLTSGNILGAERAERISRALKGQDVRVRYAFGEKSFRTESLREKGEIPYSSIIRLYETKTHYVLFATKKSGYMIEKKSVRPKELKKFEQFLSGKTGIEWTGASPLSRFNLLELFYNMKNTKKVR